MLKRLLLFIIIILLIYYFYNSSSTIPLEVTADAENKKATKELIKDKRLGLSFEKMLNHEANKKSLLLSNVSQEENLLDPTHSFLTSDIYAEKFKNDMNTNEQKEVIENLRIEIANDQDTIKRLREMGEDETIRTFEEKLSQKESQLQHFRSTVSE